MHLGLIWPDSRRSAALCVTELNSEEVFYIGECKCVLYDSE